MRAIILALALAVAKPCLADCQCEQDADGDCAGTVTCDPKTFNKLTHSEQDAIHRADVTMAANERLARELGASLEREQHPPTWALVAAGGGVVAVVLAVVMAVR